MGLHYWFDRRFHLPMLRCAGELLIMLVVLLWGAHALCDEIHDAAKNGDLEKVRSLLEHHPELVFSKDAYGATALHWAALEDRKDVAELLLVNKAEVNAKDGHDETPLHKAAFKGHKDVAELLLNNRAGVDAKNNSGQTPLLLAAFYGHADVAQVLLASRADVNAKDNLGDTPLHSAANMGHLDVAVLLIANHAEVNLQDNNGYTPLHFAAAKGHQDIAQLLLASKADATAKDNAGLTPSNWAAKNGYGTEFLPRQVAGTPTAGLDTSTAQLSSYTYSSDFSEQTKVSRKGKVLETRLVRLTVAFSTRGPLQTWTSPTQPVLNVSYDRSKFSSSDPGVQVESTVSELDAQTHLPSKWMITIAAKLPDSTEFQFVLSQDGNSMKRLTFVGPGGLVLVTALPGTKGIWQVSGATE